MIKQPISNLKSQIILVTYKKKDAPPREEGTAQTEQKES